jgi:hypothetical protein
VSDELQRRRAPFLALLPLLGLLGFGLWLRAQVIEDSRAFQAFCSATHVGETWEHVQERAAAKDWGFVRQSPQGKPTEEWLCQVELWSYHAGCVVTVAKGRVIDKRFAELP